MSATGDAGDAHDVGDAGDVGRGGRRPPLALPEDLADERHCVLTTTQRVTGRRHVVEVRFAPAEGGIYLVSGSGGLATWSLNLRSDEQAVVRIGDRSWLGRVAFLEEGDRRREEALRAFEERHGTVDRDRSDRWSPEVVVAHLVFTRELDPPSG